jgi:hypothetical protein
VSRVPVFRESVGNSSTPREKLSSSDKFDEDRDILFRQIGNIVEFLNVKDQAIDGEDGLVRGMTNFLEDPMLEVNRPLWLDVAAQFYVDVYRIFRIVVANRE